MIRSLTAFTFMAFGITALSFVSLDANAAERQYNTSSITLEEAYERSNITSKSRRLGLGSFTRRLQSQRRTTAEQLGLGNARNENNLRTSRRMGGISGGRNAYHRNLQSRSGGLRRVTPVTREANTTINNRSLLQRNRATSRERRYAGGIYGGRNAYSRYLKQKNRTNTSGVSHLNPSPVDVNRNSADTEANTR